LSIFRSDGDKRQQAKKEEELHASTTPRRREGLPQKGSSGQRAAPIEIKTRS
jgi:hypothetical protein